MRWWDNDLLIACIFGVAILVGLLSVTLGCPQ